MPRFQTIPQKQARDSQLVGHAGPTDEGITSATSISSAKGQAGRLTPDENETPTAVRIRLRAAADTPSVELLVKRAGDDVFTWRQSSSLLKKGMVTSRQVV